MDSEKNPSETNIAVELKDVTKKYEAKKVVIDKLSLQLRKEEILVLSGPSGCGKTTTLRMIAGILQPDEGSVIIEDRIVSGSKWIPPEQRPVGMVFQDYALFPHLSVEKNVGFGLRGSDKSKKNEIVERNLKLVGLLTKKHRFPHELSGGEKQRVALARALAPAPKVVLLDEPFSNLDAYLRVRVREEIRQILKKAKASTIFVTHDQEEALALADRVAVFNNGRIEQLGTPEEVYHRPLTRFVADFIGQANFVLGRVESGGIVTELGIWPAPADLEKGTELKVMLRPHDVNLEIDPDSSNYIDTRQFLGEENLYSIVLPSGQKILSTMPSHAVFQIGESVKITISRPQAVVFLGDKAIVTDRQTGAEAD